MYIGKYIVSPLVFSLFLGNSGAGELVLLVDPRFHKLVYFVWYFSVFSQNGWIQLDKLLALSFHIWWRRSFQSLGSSDYQFIVDLSNLPSHCHVVNWGLIKNIRVNIKKKSWALLIEIPKAKHISKLPEPSRC